VRPTLASLARTATELPSLLPELSDLRRSLEEFSGPLQRTLRGHVDEAFKAFRERAANVQLLTNYLCEVQSEVDRAHRRIFSPIDYEELLARAGLGRRWASLRDFPKAAKPAAFRAAKSCVTEIYKLQARQQRMMAERETRAAEIYSGLEADVAAGVAEAQRSPGRQDCWDELVALDKRLREAGRTLNDQQRSKLRAALDEGFKKVREARAAFAIEAGRRFAYYNDILGDILANLEETPTRESAFDAIDRLKPLRASLRQEKSLLRAQRAEINGTLSAASQAVEEIFERATAQSQVVVMRLSGELDVLERRAADASDWNTAFGLIGAHKQQSAAVREAQLSIAARKGLRLRLERIWEDISEKLQQLRFSRASENLDATIHRLEQQGWLLIVADVPRIT
jgi:hypothetical protein